MTRTAPFFLILVLLITTLSIGFSQPALFDESTGPTVRAVVVGVSVYKDQRIPPLQFSDKDALSFAAFLESKAGGSVPRENIRLFTNETATAANVIDAFYWLVESSSENDRAIIFFSGHGDMERVVKSAPGFWLTHDAPYNQYLGPFTVNLQIVENFVQTLQDNKVETIVISDACHSGNLAGQAVQGKGLTVEYLAKGFNQSNKILSCQADEESQEDARFGGGHSAFTFNLINGLKGLADVNKNKEVTLGELDQYLSNTVPKMVHPKKQNPFTVGNRLSVLSLVDDKTLRQLERDLDNFLPEFKQEDTRGLEMEALESASEELKTMVAQFYQAIDSSRLLQPAEDCAEFYFTKLMVFPETEPVRKSLSKNYAASLWNASGDAFHLYIKSDSALLAEKFRTDPNFVVYPDYLKRASELLAPDHYMQSYLVGAYKYFEGKLKTTQYFETGKPPELLEAAMAAQEQSLQYLEIASSYYELGIAQKDNKQIEKAIASYKKAIELSPTWSLPYDGLGKIYREMGDLAQAKLMYEKALSLSPQELLGPANRDLGFICFKLKDYVQAEKYYQEALKHSQDDPFLHYNLGSLYREMNRFKESENAFLRSVQLKPDFAAAFYYLGLVYQDEGQFLDAEAVLETALKEEPGNKIFRYHLAYNHYQMGKPEKCIELLEDLLKEDPEFFDAYYYLGVCYFETGQFPEAKANWTKAIALYPGDAEFYYQLALIQFQENDFTPATGNLQKALELQPDFPFAMYYLGMVNLRQGNQEEALRLFDKALTSLPDDPMMNYQLGVVYYEMDMLDQAAFYLKKAISLQPDFGEAYYTLGLNYRKAGRSEEAEEQLAKARELGVE